MASSIKRFKLNCLWDLTARDCFLFLDARSKKRELFAGNLWDIRSLAAGAYFPWIHFQKRKWISARSLWLSRADSKERKHVETTSWKRLLKENWWICPVQGLLIVRQEVVSFLLIRENKNRKLFRENAGKIDGKIRTQFSVFLSLHSPGWYYPWAPN